MAESNLHKLSKRGVSVWIDYLSRDMLEQGELARMMKEDAVVGQTSNPTIFQKAISQGTAYDAQLKELLEHETDPKEIFLQLSARDVEAALELFAPVHEQNPQDGFVSWEVDPTLAYDRDGTFDEAMRLHAWIDKPNLYVKIPATKPGLGAIEDCIAHGKSINVTLIFSLQRYSEVVEAYLRGLERLVAGGGNPAGVHSVASFFVSRVDTEADRRLEEIGTKDALALRGRLAVANAKLAYEHYGNAFSDPRWQYLAGKGANPQRCLWASTSTKNPEYRDVIYVEELIGSSTVNTMPEETIRRLPGPRQGARRHRRGRSRGGAQAAEEAGEGRRRLRRRHRDPRARRRPEVRRLLRAAPRGRPVEARPRHRVAMPQRSELIDRIWQRDPTVWTGADEAKWLGWLDEPRQMRERVAELAAFADGVAEEGLDAVVLLGMGGSSLAPEVLRRTFGSSSFHVLDTTHPRAIRALEATIDLERTLFVSASKSGSTLETRSHTDYFWEKTGGKGEHFVAITDPGSELERTAKERQFRHVFPGEPTIGGRYSALSPFGIVPAALLGIDVDRLLGERRGGGRGVPARPRTTPATSSDTGSRPAGRTAATRSASPTRRAASASGPSS